MRISLLALIRLTPGVLLSLIALRDAPAAFEDVADCPLILACAGCHGDKGDGSGPFPAINSLEPQDFVSTMQSFRLGEKPATVMQRIALGYTDPELLKMAHCLPGAPSQ
jgi:sulfide dehydrogenase cytochrome subunit